MAKFIIEVDDDFILENASSEKAKQNMDPNGKGIDVMKALYDVIAYSTIARKIEKGQTEFHITRDMMTDNDDKLKYWDRNITDILMLTFMASPAEKKEDE